MALTRKGRNTRAPRVNIPNQQAAIINVDGKRFGAVLCKLSINGGSVRPSKPFQAGTLAEITIRTNAGTVASAIHLLPPAAGVQGFCFVQLDPEMRSKLQNAIAQMKKAGYGDGTSLFKACTNAARRVMQLAREQIA